MTPHTEVKVQKPPCPHHPSTPSLTPALPARPHLPFTLCALTSLPMRVIGISKRWRGQKGTQPHPENLIVESLEAQHSKGESLLNYIYIHTYTSFILALLASFFIFIISKAVHHHRKAPETSSFQNMTFFTLSSHPPHHHFDTFFPLLHFVHFQPHVFTFPLSFFLLNNIYFSFSLSLNL